ncbi:glycosyltransferase family 4 protein [Aestuariibacter halophilus]|uniref:Glycosyltransferase family 4 protein n=1 Tax=Fluctibacter halophilus TaxID=226011 RepID=A0ABS8G5I6_9ALTE|nr:glycosyltransferase family 4 protein [Aestuariibacter halophilus]MCC2615857.1 glycosyltransferase family 4 protein [Aestuariibacter halophilus]
MSKTIQRVLVLGYVWPEPDSSAAGRHMVSLLKSFRAQGWEVVFASAAQRSEHQIDLGELGIEQHAVALNCSSFDRFVAQLSPDMVLFDRFMLEEQFGWRVRQQCPDALQVIDTEDLHSLRDARHSAHKQDRAMTDDDLMGDKLYRELAAILRADLSLIISAHEVALLERLGVPAHQLHHCPFILDRQRHYPAPGYDQRKGFVSIGNFRHAPNWDAVLWLKQQIWPAIRRQLPGATLHVCGAYPPPKATQLHAPKDGFLVEGWVDDAYQTIAQHRVLLAPLRFGAGLKGKLVDAMLTKTPSVTTPIGLEGLGDAAHWPGAVGHTDDEIIDAAIALHEIPQQWQQASERCEPLLAGRFAPQPVIDGLIHRLTATKAELAAHRRRCVLGQMLQHHSLKSTQYMGQWIEAKQRHNASDTNN